MTATADFAAIAITLYVAHHVGDYWVQSDTDARHKGEPGWTGRLHCLRHVFSYVLTQGLMLCLAGLVLDLTPPSTLGYLTGLSVSAITHYIADRREPLKRIAALIPGKARFAALGAPRAGHDDNSQLATGLWALDQAWHIFWGVFVAGLLIAVL
jgi:hypothetical protein